MSDDNELTADKWEDRQMRLALAQALSDSPIAGDQDHYDVFSWDKDPGPEDFYASYLRNPYTRAVTDIPVNTTWRDPPDVTDDADTGADTETDFEKELSDLVDEHRLWHYAKRADKLAGIGEYGVLVLEFSDINSPEGFKEEATSAESLDGLRPFSQTSVIDLKLGGPGSGRWGKPEKYKLDLSDENDADTALDKSEPDELWVHHSRVIHIPADALLDDEIRGTPRAEPVWNNITDIEKSLGSAAEVAYRASAWGINVNLDKDFRLDDDGEQLREHLQRWYHGLEPLLRTQGAEVNNLGGEDIDPTPVIHANIEAISAQTGIPQSVLKGNETGERATTQDLKEYYGKAGERREQFNTPVIVRRILDRLTSVGVLPSPRGGTYTVEWPPLEEESEQETAETHAMRANVVQRASTALPGYGSAEWREYLETGEFPELPDDAEDDSEPMDGQRLPDGMPAGQLPGDPEAEPGEQPALTDGGDEE